MSGAPREDGVTGGAREGHRAGDAREGHDELSGQPMVHTEPGPGEGDEDDERALRRLFRDTVAGLEPTPGSLEHLRRAVPARRARKRQAVVGAAAAAVLIGTAVPAFVHVAASGGVTAADRPVNAGHGEEAQGGTGTETGIIGGGSSRAPQDATPPRQGAAEGAAGDPSSPGADVSDGGPRQPQGTDPGTVPACAAGQLGAGAAETGAPDDEGRVYGTFRVANVSARDCLVDGGGTVGFTARGAADRSRISVVRHTPGDAGSGLPDPSRESAPLLLKPGGGYEVKFVWVPSETCPTTGATPTPTPPQPTEPTATPPPTATPGTDAPDPGTGAGSGGSGGSGVPGAGSGSEAGTAPQLLLADGSAEGSVLVSHVAVPGAPAASATISRACAGTIYRTGALGTP